MLFRSASGFRIPSEVRRTEPTARPSGSWWMRETAVVEDLTEMLATDALRAVVGATPGRRVREGAVDEPM